MNGVLGDVAGQAGTSRIGDDRVEKAAVVADVEDGRIFRHVFLADDGQADAGKNLNDLERPLHHAQPRHVGGVLVLFGKQPCRGEDGDAACQI